MKKTEYIKELNKHFYNKQALSFSKTRNNPWPGWYNILPYIKEIPAKKVRVLDLGCGNGRFLEFLLSNKLNLEYTGWDISENLIEEAKKKHMQKKQAIFEQKDILEKWGTVSKKDLIVLFGVAHHLSFKQIQDISKKAERNLRKGGIFTISFWQIHKFERFNKLVINKKNKFLDKNEFLLKWQNKKEKRYYRAFTQKELKLLAKTLEKLSLISVFEKDGREQKLNKYLVFKKTA